MAYRDDDYQPRIPRNTSFQPTPNSLLASAQHQPYADPHQPQRQSYGYNPRQSQYQQQYQDDPDDKPLRPLYYEQGEDRDERFDVRADFDGKGPRWSEMYGTGKGDPRNNAASESRPPPPSSYSKSIAPKSAMNGASREELVSVPVLGPEWHKSELHELSRRGRSEVRKEKRQKVWREWTRDQRGVCGLTWLTRKALIIGLCCLVLATAVVLFVTIPRNPSYAFYVPEPFSVDNSTVQFARTPANFSFTGNVNVLADTTSSYIPLQFSDIEVQLYHFTTGKRIATGNYGRHRVKKGNAEPVAIPVQFSYTAENATDTTWNDIYSACGHKWTGTVRPLLRLRLVLKSKLVGLVTHPETSTSINDVVCPFELPGNSV